MSPIKRSPKFERKTENACLRETFEEVDTYHRGLITSANFSKARGGQMSETGRKNVRSGGETPFRKR